MQLNILQKYCPDIKEKKRIYRKALSTEQFIERVYYCNPSFSFEKTKYKNGKTPVIVTCRRCGKDVSIIPEKYRFHLYIDCEGPHKNQFNSYIQCDHCDRHHEVIVTDDFLLEMEA
jgi:hypothetical protein